MATLLGKRKRRAPPPTQTSPSESEDEDQLRALFAKHFEAKFKPLPIETPKVALKELSKSSDEDSEAESDWSGLSSTHTPTVTIIEHKTPTLQPSSSETSSKNDLKAFLAGKPPTSANTPMTKAPLKATPTALSTEDSQENLKNDLALQRLLTESHLLSSNTSSLLNPSGKNRHKATDLRLQKLGSKTSVFKQEKMPMSHRRGIVKKTVEREGKRRKDAKENGVILEKERKGVGKERDRGRREKGVGGPGVGKFKGGVLTLSKRDIEDIQGKPDRRKGRR
jgi:hypothetical protein